MFHQLLPPWAGGQSVGGAPHVRPAQPMPPAPFLVALVPGLWGWGWTVMQDALSLGPSD